MPVAMGMFYYTIFCSQMQTCLGCVLDWLDSVWFKTAGCVIAWVSELLNPVSQQT